MDFNVYHPRLFLTSARVRTINKT